MAVELEILNWFQSIHTPLLDSFFPIVTILANHGEIWIFLALILFVIPKTRKLGISLACALLIDYLICNLFLKPLIGRVRPFVVNPAVNLLVTAPHDASFPSGHTAVSFAAVTALWLSKSSLRVPALVLAVLIALSRLYLYMHWPTDVFGGIFVGMIAGYAGVKIAELALQRISKK